jgi:hypothetical protein
LKWQIIILSICLIIYFTPAIFLDISFGKFIRDDVFPSIDKDTKLIVLAIIFAFIVPLLFASIHSKLLDKKFKRFRKRRFTRFYYLYIWLCLISLNLVLVHYIIRTPHNEGRAVDLSYQVISQNPGLPYKSVFSVDLKYAQLQGANLIASVLIGADLRFAILQSAVLTYSKLDSADLREADLSNADLTNAVLIQADLSNANLVGSKGLTSKQLCSARSLFLTKLDSNWADSVRTFCPKLLDDTAKQ